MNIIEIPKFKAVSIKYLKLVKPVEIVLADSLSMNNEPCTGLYDPVYDENTVLLRHRVSVDILAAEIQFGFINVLAHEFVHCWEVEYIGDTSHNAEFKRKADLYRRALKRMGYKVNKLYGEFDI